MSANAPKCALSGFNLQAQRLQPLLFVLQLSERYLERDMVDCALWYQANNRKVIRKRNRSVVE